MSRYTSIAKFIISSIIGSIKVKKKIKCYGSFSCGNYKNLELGKNITMNSNVYIQARNKVSIGDNCVLSRGASIFDAGLDPLDYSKHVASPVVIMPNVWIGANAIILPGVHVGENSIVAAGSVVTKSFPARCLIAGNPAKLIKSI